MPTVEWIEQLPSVSHGPCTTVDDPKTTLARFRELRHVGEVHSGARGQSAPEALAPRAAGRKGAKKQKGRFQ